MNGNILFQDPRLTGRLFKEAFLDLFAVCNVRKEEIHINWKIKIKK